jgi:hypothetical protein
VHGLRGGRDDGGGGGRPSRRPWRVRRRGAPPRLRTQPARPSDSAVDAVQSRNPTPCTRPFTTTWTAFRAGSSCCFCGWGGAEALVSAEVAMASAEVRSGDFRAWGRPWREATTGRKNVLEKCKRIWRSENVVGPSPTLGPLIENSSLRHSDKLKNLLLNSTGTESSTQAFS